MGRQNCLLTGRKLPQGGAGPSAVVVTPVHLLIIANIWSANHTPAIQCNHVYRHGKNNLLKFKPINRMREKCDFSDFERGTFHYTNHSGEMMLVDQHFRCCWSPGIYQHKPPSNRSEIPRCWYQSRTARRLQTEGKATVTKPLVYHSTSDAEAADDHAGLHHAPAGCDVINVNKNQNLWEMFPAPCWLCAIKN